jgi:antitoxin Phd
MTTMTSAEAQNRFGQLIETAQREAVVVTRHGRPSIFVVSSAEMADLVELRRRRKQAAREFAAWRRLARTSRGRTVVSLTDRQIDKMLRALR